MTILAFGCSVTHGTEIVALGNSKDNIPFSYPALIAEYLGVSCDNRAFCGNSNENIFHETLDTIPKVDNITAVIVGWTSVEREVWQSNGRTWQFIPSWSATTTNVWRPFRCLEPAVSRTPQRCADRKEYMTALASIYEVLIQYKFDHAVYTKKRNNYISALRAYCQTNNIKLIETTWADTISGVDVNLGRIGTWYPAMQRHPDADEQQLFANEIIKQYQL
jgi:hypothetical protein